MTRQSIITAMVLGILLSGLQLSGCVMPGSKAKPNPELAAQYIEKGKVLEKKGDLPEAYEQYKLALTVDPKNPEASQNRERLNKELSKLADQRYRMGMKYHRQGKYGLARKEFLTALKYQPNHPKASKMLVSRQPEKSPGYVLHTVKEGESLSSIAKQYYGDYKKFNIIARFNNIVDATHVNPGQTIMIPDINRDLNAGAQAMGAKKTTGFVWHTIAPGQSISKLAQIYYGDYNQFHIIARYNGMDDATRIKIGDRVKVPKVNGLPFNDPAQHVEKDVSAAPGTLATPSSATVAPASKIATSTSQPEESVVQEDTNFGANGEEQILAYRDSGIELYNEGKYEDAIFELNKAVEAKPNDQQTRTYLAKAYLEAGKALFDQKDFNAAREAFESSKQYNPQCALCAEYIDKARTGPALIHRANGIESLNRNDFALAIAEFEKFLLAKPGDPEGRSFLSRAYFQKALIDYNKGEFLAAKRGFESALNNDSRCEKCASYVNQSLISFKDVHYNKGVVYYGKQQLAEAVSEWEMVYDLDPDYKDVEQNLKKAKDLLAKLEKIKKSRQP